MASTVRHRTAAERYRTMFDAGRDNEYIARRMGVKVATVRDARHRLGYPPKPPPTRGEQYKRMREAGFSVDAIAERMGVKRSSVVSRLWDMGMGIGPNRANEEQNRRIFELYNAGKTPTEIASILDCGITAGAIGRRISDARKRGEAIRPAREQMPWTEEELARAKVMLDDGMSYKMVVEELDRSPHAAQSLAKHFPGKGWTSSQTQEYRWMKHRLENL